MAFPSHADTDRRQLSAENGMGQLDDLLTGLRHLDQRLDVWLHQMRSPNPDRFDGNLHYARQRIESQVDSSPDVVTRVITVGQQWRWPTLLVYVDGLTAPEMIDQDIIQRLMEASGTRPQPDAVAAVARKCLVTGGHVTQTSNWETIWRAILEGETAIFFAGCSSVLLVDTVKYPARSIPSSQSEPSIKGPQEAFNEVGLTHMDQLRRWIRSPSLHFDTHRVGAISQTPVMIAYLADVVNAELLDHVVDRVERIQRDVVTRANDVAEYLPERRWSLFPQYRLSERVDWVARELSEGKIAILVENDPFAILLPMTLVDFYQTSQDYSVSWWDGTLVRLIRLIALIIGLYLMPLYIALTSVDVDLVPTPLLLTITGSRQGIPFPPVVEVIIMYVIIEILREAANRLPQELAVTLGTVGAVVVGTAIVKAGIVDDVMIVSATLTALGLFATPAFEMSTPWRWLFWIMVLGAFTLGVFGMVMVTVGIIAYLASLESFGVPYFSPFGPLRLSSWKDAWWRAPIPVLEKRPVSLRPTRRRQAAPSSSPDPFSLHPNNDLEGPSS
ncbi:spore germination protein [Sulfobacillus harzensis]|uniref:Spore germination protein n=1 Tax=Sulfobacillus harzensis TaxID=2729629 RepID=A0A7Y0L707_9FIRM|nr:spore germination protein [Sulfobacillus harzensis]NMP24193.1 spore germination protein [Sulfobacillus harzensis]